MKKLIQRKDGSEKCPHCGTVFGPESLHPFDIEVREQFRKRRSLAAKKRRSKPKCDCHLYERRVCNICQTTGKKKDKVLRSEESY